MLDIAICLLFFLLGVNLKKWFKGFSAYDRKILNYLYFWHIAIGIGYVLYISSQGGGDAFSYWEYPKENSWNNIWNIAMHGSASGYIFIINYFPSRILELSFFTGSMMYTTLGYAGFVLLYKSIKESLKNYYLLSKIKILKIPVFPYFLFLPNLHFWTSGLGKDTLLFFSIILFIYSIRQLRSRWGFMLVSIILAVFIRPHILLFLFVAWGLAFVFDARMRVYQKVILYLIFIVGSIIMIPYVMNFAHIDSLDADTIESYTNHKARALANKEGTGSAIDISGYPYPLKVFTFLFRPLFIDMPTALGMAASLENFVFLVFFIRVWRKKPFSAFKKMPLLVKTALFFFIIGSLIFPLLLGNLGIILRQKTPFIILFLIFGFWVLEHHYSLRWLKSNKKNENITLHQ